MNAYSPKHRNKYFVFVEHTKPKRRRGRHAAAVPVDAPSRVRVPA